MSRCQTRMLLVEAPVGGYSLPVTVNRRIRPFRGGLWGMGTLLRAAAFSIPENVSTRSRPFGDVA